MEKFLSFLYLCFPVSSFSGGKMSPEALQYADGRPVEQSLADLQKGISLKAARGYCN